MDLAELSGLPLSRKGGWVQVAEHPGHGPPLPGTTQSRGHLHPSKLLSPTIIAALLCSGPVSAQQGEVVRDSIAGNRIWWELVRVPAGVVVQGSDTVQVDEFLIGRTEVPWELYDIFYLRFDLPRGERDSVSTRLRPSRPYGAPDHGFGHRGYPAISVTHDATRRFVAWLSERTGNRYTLLTDAQWQRAAELGFPDGFSTEQAWTPVNADGSTHPVGSVAPDELGVFDLLGNAAEWVVDAAGNTWLRGGSYSVETGEVSVDSRAEQQPSWNATDPQIPKSRWWLSDGPFAGFRLARIP